MLSLRPNWLRISKWLHQQSPSLSMRPVSVCFVIDRLSRAGTESQLLALIHNLDRKKVQPCLVLLDGESKESQRFEPDNCPILRLGIRSLFSAKPLSAAFRLTSFWRKNRVDVVQCYFVDSAYFAIPLARLSGIKKIIRVRNNSGYAVTSVHRLLGRLLAPSIDCFMTNSEVGVQSFQRLEKVPNQRIQVMPNGLDLSRYHVELNPKHAVTTIGIVANLRPIKNIDGFVRVAAQLVERNRNLRFRIVGDGPQRQEIEQLIQKLKLQANVELLGSIADIPAFLHSIDIAVLCSHSEGLSNALLEYMAAGKAIVVTEVGAAKTLIQHGQHGLLVPPANEEALKLAIERMLHSMTLRESCGKAARKRVEKEFALPVVVQQYEQFYQQLIHD